MEDNQDILQKAEVLQKDSTKLVELLKEFEAYKFKYELLKSKERKDRGTHKITFPKSWRCDFNDIVLEKLNQKSKL